jgi:hypothetical protein
VDRSSYCLSDRLTEVNDPAGHRPVSVAGPPDRQNRAEVASDAGGQGDGDEDLVTLAAAGSWDCEPTPVAAAAPGCQAA